MNKEKELRTRLKNLRFKGDADYCAHEGNSIQLNDRAIELFMQLVHQQTIQARIEFAYFTRDNATLEDVEWLDKRIAEMEDELGALRSQQINKEE